MLKCLQLPFTGGKHLLLKKKKIRELKTRVAKLNIQKLKVSPTKIILKSTENMNSVASKNCGLSPNEIEKI